MKNITSKIRNITAAIALVVLSVAPAFKVAAIENEDNYVWINIRGATELTVEGTDVVATYNDGLVAASGVADAIVGYDANHDFGENNFGPLYTLYTTSEDVVFDVLPNTDMGVQIFVAENGNVEQESVSGDGTYAMHYLKTYGYNDLHTVYDIEFSFYEEGNNPPQPGNDIEAELRLSCADSSTNCFQDSGFSINGGMPMGVDPAFPTDPIIYHYDGDENDEKVVFRAETLWHKKFTGSIFVNGQEIAVPIDYDDTASWFDHYGDQVVGFEFEVPKTADNVYEIVYNTAINSTQHVGNFLWSADPADEFRRAKDENGKFFKDEDGNWVYEHDEQGNLIPGDDYVGHTRMELVAIEYTTPDGKVHSCDLNTGMCNIVEYNEQGEPMGLGCLIEDEECISSILPWVEFDTSAESETFEQGSLVLPAGARVTMRVIPDYGYQVLNVNMAELVTSDDGIGEFTFTVPAGAAYFVADVTAIEDEVNADESEMIESGSIDLGDDQTTLDHGTARLTIEDLALSDEEKKVFAEQVGDDGYEMKTYLDISLYNITYRGDTDSAWEEQVDNLNEEATITLQLADDVDGNQVVIVHKKHDGAYEVIPAEYDSAAHTITFKTSSFSDYAIAARTVVTPDTGVFTASDSASVVISGFVIAQTFLALFAFVVFVKKYRTE